MAYVRVKGEKYNTRLSVLGARGVVQTDGWGNEGSLWAGVIGGGLLEKVATEANLEGQGEALHQIEAMREDILGRGGQVQDMLRLEQVHPFGWNLGFV